MARNLNTINLKLFNNNYDGINKFRKKSKKDTGEINPPRSPWKYERLYP